MREFFATSATSCFDCVGCGTAVHSVGTTAAGSAARQSAMCNSTDRRPLKLLMTGRNANDERSLGDADKFVGPIAAAERHAAKPDAVLIEPQRKMPAVADSLGRFGQAHAAGA